MGPLRRSPHGSCLPIMNWVQYGGRWHSERMVLRREVFSRLAPTTLWNATRVGSPKYWPELFDQRSEPKPPIRRCPTHRVSTTSAPLRGLISNKWPMKSYHAFGVKRVIE